MLELSTIARPYAEAVFQVAQQNQEPSIADWAKQFALWSVVAQHPDVLACFKNPKLGKAQVLELFAAACKADGSVWPQVYHNFLQTLADNNRLSLLPEVERQFLQLKSEHEGCADALLESAFSLSDDQLAALKPDLEKRFGTRLNLMVKVCPELIGGVRICVGDQVLDNSVRARLEAMKQTLLA